MPSCVQSFQAEEGEGAWVLPTARRDGQLTTPQRHEPEPTSYDEDPYAYEKWKNAERRAYKLAWKAAGGTEWVRAGHARWARSADHNGGGDLELEEVLETIKPLPNLRHLTLDDFKRRLVVPSAFKSQHFAPARAIIGRLAGLRLKKSSGAFSGWISELPTARSTSRLPTHPYSSTPVRLHPCACPSMGLAASPHQAGSA